MDRRMNKEKSYKELVAEQVEELQGLKYSVTRPANEIEILDKTMRELIAYNQMLIAKLTDSLIPVLKADLEPKGKIDKVK
jgi:hypothetical protein